MNSSKGKVLHWIMFVLIIVGALNWGLIGLFEFDLVATLFGDMSTVSRIVYSLVGVAAVVKLVTYKKCCQSCCGGKCCEVKESSSPVSGNNPSDSTGV